MNSFLLGVLCFRGQPINHVGRNRLVCAMSSSCGFSKQGERRRSYVVARRCISSVT